MENSIQRISRSNAAKILGVTPQTVSNLAKRGALSVTKEGKWQYFSREEVESIIPKLEGVRSVENKISDVEKELHSLYHERNNVMEISRARSNFIKRVSDVSTWHRYRDLIMTLYQSVCRTENIENRLSLIELNVLEMIVSLKPMPEISQRLGMTPQYIQRVFYKAVRKIYRYADTVAADFDSMRRKLDEANGEISRLKTEKEQMAYNLTHAERMRPVKDAMMVNIADLDMSVRARNCLRAAEINTLGDLAKYTRRDLLRHRNFGRITMHEVENLMDRFGLKFKESV